MPKLTKQEQVEINEDLAAINLLYGVDIFLSVCCQCGEVYNIKEGRGNYGLSHGYCKDCLIIQKENT